jgi:5-formyltetrahydrofolate cyclo-ligase
VITPLVAFDSLGSRLGMGGGFYDTTFMFKRYSYSPQRPRLLGFAYDFQQVEKLESNPWDVALDAVLTEVGFLPFSAGLY